MLILSLGVGSGDEAVITTPSGDEIVVRVLDRSRSGETKGAERSVRVGFDAAKFIRIRRRPYGTVNAEAVGAVSGAMVVVPVVGVGGGRT